MSLHASHQHNILGSVKGATLRQRSASVWNLQPQRYFLRGPKRWQRMPKEMPAFMKYWPCVLISSVDLSVIPFPRIRPRSFVYMLGYRSWNEMVTLSQATYRSFCKPFLAPDVWRELPVTCLVVSRVSMFLEEKLNSSVRAGPAILPELLSLRWRDGARSRPRPLPCSPLTLHS
jgi:hypothetical protein